MFVEKCFDTFPRLSGTDFEYSVNIVRSYAALYTHCLLIQWQYIKLVIEIGLKKVHVEMKAHTHHAKYIIVCC
jgi:hypothetical protein